VNKKANAKDKAMIPFLARVPKGDIYCDELIHMSDKDEWDYSVPQPIISKDVIIKFLARVHPFIAVGLETQATAYSFEKDGVIKYLAILPQLNEPARVTTDDDAPSDFTVFEAFKQKNPKTINGTYYGRCWIHTHPRWRTFMSSIDTCQLFFYLSCSVVTDLEL